MSKTIGLVLALKDECSPKLKEVADKIGVTEKELKRANQSIKKFQKELGDGLKNACKTAIVGLGALATATVATVQQTMKHGDEIDKMSQKMQMSRKAYQELDYVFSQNGADISMMQTGMSKLTKAMDGAKLGTKSYILTFNRLGISLKDTKGRMKSTETVMFEALNKLQKMPEGATKTALALQLFGKSATELAPLLNGNAKGVEELRKKFNDLGMGMSDEAINASVKFTDTMDTLKRSFQGCVYTVGADLMPIFQSLADTVQSNMPQIKATVVPVFKSIAAIVQFVIKHIKAITIATTLCVASFAAFKTLSFVGGVLTSISETIEITKGGIGLLKVANYALGQSADFANAKITLMFGWQKLKGVLEAVTTAQWGLNTAVTAFSRISIILILAEIIIHFKDICKWAKTATDAVRKFLGEDSKQLNAKVAQARPQIKYVVDSYGKTWDKNQYKIQNGRAVKINGSHANGLANVPFNGYVAELHKGERVLTANENKNYNTTTNNTERTININFYGDIIGDESFLQKLENRFTSRLRAELGAL